MEYKMDDFEVINHNNSTNLLQAITYIDENLDTKALQKIKRNMGDTENIEAALAVRILSLMNAKNFKPMFRRTAKSHNLLTNIWVSEIRSKAQSALLKHTGKSQNKPLTKKILQEIATLSNDEDSLKYIDSYLYDNHGIILVYAKNIEGMNTDAITFKLEGETPVIGMSLKYNRYDYFWFTLMHELAHICLHNDMLDEPHFDHFNEESNNVSMEEIEIEANALAKSSLIPRRAWSRFRARKEFHPTTRMIDRFSEDHHIHRIIAAGFLRKEREQFTLFSDIVHSLDVRSLLGEKL